MYVLRGWFSSITTVVVCHHTLHLKSATVHTDLIKSSLFALSWYSADCLKDNLWLKVKFGNYKLITMAHFTAKERQEVFHRLIRACRSNDMSLINNRDWKAKLKVIPKKDAEDIITTVLWLLLSRDTLKPQRVFCWRQHTPVWTLSSI